MDRIKEGKKRYGMSQGGMIAGYECCEYEGQLERSDDALMAERSEDMPDKKFGGFLTRNNTWERI